MLNKLLITRDTSPEEITEHIKVLREQKGKEKETLELIEESLSFGHEFVINLFFEEALTHQHLFMNDQSNKKAITDMEKSILKADFYINKYKLTKWKSRLFRFLGRIADYRGQYKKAVGLYRKSIKFVKLDTEPFRILELEGLLSFSLMMSGSYSAGYKLARETYNKFRLSPEGKLLNKKDYQTWAIWISGLVMRTIKALLDKKLFFDEDKIEIWLKEVESYLKKGKDFSYRKA